MSCTVFDSVDSVESVVCVCRSDETALPWVGGETLHQSPQADWTDGGDTVQPPV